MKLFILLTVGAMQTVSVHDLPAEFTHDQCERIGAMVGGMDKVHALTERRTDYSVSYACLTEAEVAAYTQDD